MELNNSKREVAFDILLKPYSVFLLSGVDGDGNQSLLLLLFYRNLSTALSSQSFI